MKKKSPITIFSAMITLGAAAAIGLSSCKSVEEQPPETDNLLPQVVTDYSENAETSGNSEIIFTYADSEASDHIYEIITETAYAETDIRAADPDNSEEYYDTSPVELQETYSEKVHETYSEEIHNEELYDDDPYIPAGGEIEDAVGVTDISLTFYEISMSVGDVKMPIVTMYPEDASDKSEIWENSNSDIAEVDGKGNITAVSSGDCVITVRSAANPEVSAEVRVHVKQEVTEPTYIDGILIANKTYALPRDYNPGVDPDAKDAFDEMQKAAAAEGLNIYISSGFRSYDYQAGLYERYVQRSGKAEADRYSARPGHSEHQSGLAFDLNSIDMTFEDTPECEWVNKHCADYGFIIRYPKDGEAITGYMYEPWHIRYLGKDTARKVYDSGLTLEEYLGIDSKYDE